MTVGWSLLAACLWVLAAAGTAMLPYRRQFPPGIVLLVLEPAILVWIGLAYGAVPALLGTLGFVSMFRRPLWFLSRRALGLSTPRPPGAGPDREAGP